MLPYSSYILIALAALLVTCHALSKCPGISGLPGIPGRDGLKGKETWKLAFFATDPCHKGCMTRNRQQRRTCALKEAAVLSRDRKTQWRKWTV